uniref:Conserved hypothetical plastid protein n=1 Tax=Flintiella sanguinaria TaxID=101926 RepID=A0A1X9PUJ0_9RHOD|nr:conserved hypothetical plastid protein [Flintiella sanguinaria]
MRSIITIKKHILINIILFMLNNLFNQEKISYNLPKTNVENIDLSQITIEETKRSFIEKHFLETLIISNSSDNENNDRFGDKDIKEKKAFQKEFTNTLFNGRIEINIETNNNEIENPPLNSIKYIWNKCINLLNQNSPEDELRKETKNRFPNIKQKKLMENLKYTPIFVIKNGFNQMIMGFPEQEFRKNWLDQLYDIYKNKYLLNTERDKYPTSFGFLFVNPNDAIELKEYIYKKYPYSSKQMDIQVYPISLQDGYKFNRTSRTRIQFRFIPDFTEISNLLSNCKNDKNIIFDPRQKYGKDYFQGQPIYQIMPFSVKQSGKEILLEYSGKIDPFTNKRKFLFTNLEGLKYAWEEFRERFPNLKLPKKPKIIVYNLESFLKDYEMNITQISEDFAIITNKTAITRTKDIANQKIYMNGVEAFSHKIYPKVLSIKVWAERMLWALKSKQAPEL